MPLLHPHDMKRAWLRRRTKAKAKRMIRKTCPASAGRPERLTLPLSPRRDAVEPVAATTVDNESPLAADEPLPMP
jgi:hypothetical protein